jgi:hypothetical protein
VKHLVDRPLVHFLLLGAAAFAASRSFPALRGERPSFAAAADEDTLVREAFRLGLDRRDPVVRRRLVANLRFAGADPQASDAALVREAVALGMEKTDIVVRRRLVQAMEERLATADGVREPSDAELANFLEANAERFTVPAAWRFRHVLVSRQRHLYDLERAAQELRAALVEGGAGPDAALLRSDPFLLGNRFGPSSRAEIAAAFGDDFAAAIATVEPGRWSEPLATPWGLHLVWVDEATAEHRATLDQVRGRVRLAWLAERSEVARRRGLALLQTAGAFR